MENTVVSSQQNDDFASLRGTDLLELLAEIENYFLEYRESLNLPRDLTFGVELEYEGLPKVIMKSIINKQLSSWKITKDGSLEFGEEIISPVMTDDIKYWRQLEFVCTNLTKWKANTSKNAGGHVHIGAAILGEDIEAWRSFLKLYIAYENVLFRFAYGDKTNGRRKLAKYAPPIADRIYPQLSTINKADSIWDLYPIIGETSKYAALNFWNFDYNNPTDRQSKNTLEFRMPNATSNAVIWQNNINAFAKMLTSAKDKVIDEDFLDYKLRSEYYPYAGYEYMYNSVNLKNVLEFVDLVFDNNQDKSYFLRQYLKGFQESSMGIAKPAKKFIK